MKQKTTIHDIAKGLNVNASTVSRALRGHSSVSAATRQRVLEQAEAMNYQPNRIAAALRKGHSKILGVVVTVTARTFYASIIRGIEEAANQAGYRVVVSQSHDVSEREEALLETLAELQVDGLLISMAKEGTTQKAVYEKLKQQGIKLHFFDVVPTGYGKNSVVTDDYLGAYLATEHLIEQGYQCIAHLKGPQHLQIYRDRARGYRDALEKAGLPLDDGLEVDVASTRAAGQEAFAQLSKQEPRPDAVFSASDFATLGFQQAALAAGWSIPEELGLVGYANEPFTEFVTPSLSTVDPQSRQMGTQAAERLLASIKGDEQEGSSQLTLRPELIIRASSTRIKNDQ